MSPTSASAPTLEVVDLSKRYTVGPSVVHALADVSLTLHRGEFVAVMGASGSGKSTLLHLVAGLTQPDHGSVCIAGIDLFALSDSRRTLFRRRNVGLVFQAFNLIPTLTGRENIELPLLLAGAKRSSDYTLRLIADLGLHAVADRYPDTMSGGEQQRVAIGRALVTQPPLILADEPTGSLDSVNGQRLCHTLRKLCAEHLTTVLMVTHNPLVAFNAQRVIVLHDGAVVHQCLPCQYSSVQDFASECIAATGSPAGVIQ